MIKITKGSNIYPGIRATSSMTYRPRGLCTKCTCIPNLTLKQNVQQLKQDRRLDELKLNNTKRWQIFQWPNTYSIMCTLRCCKDSLVLFTVQAENAESTALNIWPVSNRKFLKLLPGYVLGGCTSMTALTGWVSAIELLPPEVFFGFHTLIADN